MRLIPTGPATIELAVISATLALVLGPMALYRTAGAVN